MPFHKHARTVSLALRYLHQFPPAGVCGKIHILALGVVSVWLHRSEMPLCMVIKSAVIFYVLVQLFQNVTSIKPASLPLLSCRP